MPKKTRSTGDDLRGASQLVTDATDGVMALVEEMHRTIASGPAVLGSPLAGPARQLTRVVYGGLRGATKLVGSSVDRALTELAPLLGERVPGPERDAVLAALNGVLGDYLAEHGNALAIDMELRHAGHSLMLQGPSLDAALPAATGKVLVLLHGSCMHDGQWLQGDHDHGAALAQELGYTAIYARYNSGLHISSNGRALSDQLESLTSIWPVPIERLVLVGHSMGGLVARSACHTAEQAGHGWRARLTTLVTLGSPHQGAPLERGGSWLHALLGVSRYSAPFARLARIRSAGVTDLRFGNVLDAHWDRRDRFAVGGDTREALPLPKGVACFAIAATLSDGGESGRTPAVLDALRGDGLVPVASALGRHARPELALGFDEARCRVVLRTGHIGLLSSAEVYDALRAWLA